MACAANGIGRFVQLRPGTAHLFPLCPLCLCVLCVESRPTDCGGGRQRDDRHAATAAVRAAQEVHRAADGAVLDQAGGILLTRLVFIR
jgi:hypothetical protein